MLFPQEYIFDQYKNQSQYTLFSKDTLQNTSLFPNRNIQPVDFDKVNFYKENRKWLARKILQDNLISIDKLDTLAGEVNRFRFSADPLFNFQYGKTNETGTPSCYTNTRGLIARFAVNDNFYFETAFLENQSTFLSYIDSAVVGSKEVLGQGRWKSFKNDPNNKQLIGFDYAMASGVLWWKPAKFFEIYLGHGKQKIGNGYRSLLLSDQSFNYPYARFDLNFEKAHIKYTSTYALLMNLSFTSNSVQSQAIPFGTEKLLQKKPFSYQYVSWTPIRNLSIGVFQGIVWKPSDERNRLSPNLDILNPLIGVNTGIYGFNSFPKILLGLDASVKLTKKLHTYFQLAYDGKKGVSQDRAGYGWQFGIKAFDAFTVKNLFLQVESNVYQNSLYQANNINSIANYSHYGNTLTLPVHGNSGNEVIGILAYRYKRLLMSAKGNYYTAFAAQNVITSFDCRLSFIVMPKTNMNIYAGFVQRQNTPSPIFSQFNTLQSMIYFGFKTSLYNTYFDF